jgi:hypothetical protein
MDTSKVTRLEVIDHRASSPNKGRAMVLYHVKIELSLQDSDQTLKIFVEDSK